MTHYNLGVCLIHLHEYKKAEEILNESLKKWDHKKQRKYYFWALYNLADIKSKTGRTKEAQKDFEEAFDGLKTIVAERDRFLSLLKVLWAKHLLRHADECSDDKEKQRMLNEAYKL